MQITLVEEHELGREGRRLVKVVNGDYWLWPQGVGIGPCIVFTPEEWRRMQDEARLASMAYQQALRDCE